MTAQRLVRARQFQLHENNLVHMLEDITNASVVSEKKLPLVNHEK